MLHTITIPAWLEKFLVWVRSVVAKNMKKQRVATGKRPRQTSKRRRRRTMMLRPYNQRTHLASNIRKRSRGNCSKTLNAKTDSSWLPQR